MNGNDLVDCDFEKNLQDYAKSSRSSLRPGREMGVALTSMAAIAVCTTESEAVTMMILVDEALTPGGGGNSVFLDFTVNGLGVDFEFAADDTASYPFVKAGARNGVEVVGRTVGGFPYASRLGSAQSVGPTLNFLPDTGPAINKLMAFSYPASASFGGDWFGGETGFIGIRVPNGADFNYGWIEVEVNPDSVSGTIIRYGIEMDVNTPAITGVGVPETNSLACLALGAAGLLSWRQRRKAA